MVIIDIEADSLKASKIHVLSYYDFNTNTYGSITDYEEMKLFLSKQDTIIGHNFIRYDAPTLERILDIKIKANIIDTLAVSWYLYDDRLKHGLEVWGEELGIKKPIIKDWSNLKVEEYIHRCEQDVLINKLLWEKQIKLLNEIYNSRTKKILSYLTFKMECAREQEEVKWRLDVDKVKENLKYFEEQKEIKFNNLKAAMPKSHDIKTVNKPKSLLKKDGSLSVSGQKWLDLLEERGLPISHEESINVITNSVEGNPNSHIQMKNWLFSLGWEPETFKTNDKGEEIPQISNENKEVCNSIKLLYSKEPSLVNLESLSVISHRIGLLKGFLSNQEDGYLKAEIAGFTNTMRFKHSIIVNLPKVFTKNKRSFRDGVYIRECLVAEDDYVLCGSDMCSLEDTTKQHYMYDYDPEYVMKMRVKGFDPHLDIAILAGLLTEEEAELHKLFSKTDGAEGKNFGDIRGKAKTVNFSGVYGVGPPKLAKTLNCTIEFARNLHKTYWSRNKAVIQIANDTNVKVVDKKMWLYNPVSKLYYPLRYEKDKFSTLNQSTGVYCFDSYVKQVRKKFKLSGQFHDEIIVRTKIGNENEVREYLLSCINKVNKEIKLNVELGVDIKFGSDYSKIH